MPTDTNAPPPLPGDKGYRLHQYRKGGSGPPPRGGKGDDKGDGKGDKGGPGGGMPSEAEMKSIADEAEDLMSEMGIDPAGGDAGAEAAGEDGGEDAAPPGADAAAPSDPAASGDPGATIASVLGVDPEKGAAFYDAAQEYEKTKGMAPDKLAALIDRDYQVRMALEEIIAGKEDKTDEGGMGDSGGMPPGMTGMAGTEGM